MSSSIGIKRDLFNSEHDLFRKTARSFFNRECAPHAAEWEEAGIVDREVWRRAGAAGLLGWEAPEEFGGLGIHDYRFNVIITEEFILTGSVGFCIALHNDVLAPYLIGLSDAEQKRRWLPGWVSGDLVTAIAMTEPNSGSDLAGIRTTAVADGDSYVLNGSKTFITNGLSADLVLVAAKTDPDAGHRGISLLVVENGMEGFERGRKLDKVGLRSQDTAELHFSNVRVPRANLIGEENRGFYHLMSSLPQERLTATVTSAAMMERALELTVEYVRQRSAFGTPLSHFQNTRFKLADAAASCAAVRSYVDHAIAAHLRGELTPTAAASMKLWVTERHWEVVDSCVQLFGGNGFMNEYEIARIWRDSRIQRVYAGSNEIMREIVSRDLLGRIE
jgi:alkylation response protein AidB-like acyl-CoA dehydrogenase